MKLTTFVAVIFLATSLGYNMLTSAKTNKESTIIDIPLDDPSAPRPRYAAAPAANSTAPAANSTAPLNSPFGLVILHQPAARQCRRLNLFAPGTMPHCFLADNAAQKFGQTAPLTGPGFDFRQNSRTILVNAFRRTAAKA